MPRPPTTSVPLEMPVLGHTKIGLWRPLFPVEFCGITLLGVAMNILELEPHNVSLW